MMELRRPSQARAALVRAVELDPDLAEARYRLAFALSALGDYQGALRETKLALELDPYFPTPRFRLLIDLQYEEARILAPELDPAEQVKAGGEIETFDFHSGSLESTFAELEPGESGKPEATAPSGSGDSPEDAGELLHDARAALEAGQYDVARETVRRAVAGGEADQRDLLLLQGDLFLAQELAGEALERYQLLLERVEDEAEDAGMARRARVGLTRALLLLDRVPEAVEAAEAAVRAHPGRPEVLRVLADALRRAGEPGRAAEILREAGPIGSDDPGMLLDIGESLLQAGDAEGAEASLREALRLDPGGLAARRGLARVLEATGREGEAAEELGRILEVLPSFGEAALALADLQVRRGRRAAAINALVKLLAADPYHIEGLYRLGVLLLQEGRRADAMTALERVRRFDPDHAGAAGTLREMDETMAPATVG